LERTGVRKKGDAFYEARAHAPFTPIRPARQCSRPARFACCASYDVYFARVEHLVRDEGVAGSNPATPTKKAPQNRAKPNRDSNGATGPGQISGQNSTGLAPEPPAAIILTVAPALNPDGRRAYSSRGPLFVGMIGDRRIVERSPQPFVDAARALLAEGISPDTRLAMRHGGSPDDALRSTVGVSARQTVSDTNNGKPIFRRWAPNPNASEPLPGKAPVRQTAEARPEVSP